MVNSLCERSLDEWRIAIERHMYSAFSAALCFAPAADWHEDGQYTRFVTGFQDPFGNLVWNAHLRAETVDEDVQSIIAPIARLSAPSLWLAGPSSEPSNLCDRLLAHGYVPTPAMETMAIDLSGMEATQSPSTASFEEVCDDDALRGWLEALGAGFGILPDVAAGFGHWPRHLGYSSHSHMRAFLATRDGQPVGSSLLYLHDGVAGIYCVAVVPEARRQGIGRALTLLPLLEARKAGYRVGVLQATEMGSPVYRQIGFQPFGPVQVYFRPGAPGEDSPQH